MGAPVVSWREKKRERIELVETPRFVVALVVMVAFGGLLLLMVLVAIVVSLHPPGALVVLAGVGLAVAYPVGLALIGWLIWSRRPVTAVLHLTDRGASIGSPSGDVLGTTADVLVIRRAHYWRPGSRGGGGFRGALVLEVHGRPLGAVSCLGPTDVDAHSPRLERASLGDLYPREFEALARHAR